MTVLPNRFPTLFWMIRAGRVLALRKSVTYGKGTRTMSPR